MLFADWDRHITSLALADETGSVATANFVFTSFQNLSDQPNLAFAIVLGLTIPSWSFIETINAYRDVAKGMIYSVMATSIVGFILVVGLAFSIQHSDLTALDAMFPLSPMSVVLDVTQSVTAGTLISCLVGVSLFFSGVAMTTAAVFPTSLSARTIGLMIAYGIPIFCKLIFGKRTFEYVWWILNAHKWFVVPVKHIRDEEIIAMQASMDAAKSALKELRGVSELSVENRPYVISLSPLATST
ncbi:hypothetical protein HDU93_006193 [Gonapodya sp. JEL0774]|nr:hypothetical protein HDU93_006193 [Gonapodya sp. JEL0774]